jgi:hypothetical protein
MNYRSRLREVWRDVNVSTVAIADWACRMASSLSPAPFHRPSNEVSANAIEKGWTPGR